MNLQTGAARSAFAGLILALAAAAAPAWAQEFPSKPVRIIVPYGPGGPSDIVARTLGSSMSKLFGQPVLVENKPGASGLLAYEYVAKQVPADGYTIVLGDPSMTSYPVFFKDLKFDPLKDLPPFTIVAALAQILASPAQMNWGGFADMVAYGKANPGKLNFGVPGLQNPQALYAEVFKQKNNLAITSVPYKGGGAEIRQAIISNQVQLAIYTEDMVVADGNRVKVLGIAGDKRHPNFPNVPTFKELAHDDVAEVFLTLNAPGATPRPVVEKLYSVSTAAMRTPEVREGMGKLGLPPVASTTDVAVQLITARTRANIEIGKRAGIKPE